jgi:hypothetical protein
MREHDLIILEEPPVPEFPRMIRGEMEIQEYLEGQDFEFPAHAEGMCRLARDLSREGKALLQVEPYLEHLIGIHEFFAAGGEASAIEPHSPAAAVYRAEHQATRALMAYYQISMQGSFELIVESVKIFARADAARLRLRDVMRAQALIDLFDQRGEDRFYVEAGYIHWALWKEMNHRLPRNMKLQMTFLLESVVKPLLNRRQTLGPGDVLTLLYVFHPGLSEELLDLLAARSLVYIKILMKSELPVESTDFPHTLDEIDCIRMVKRLSFEECRQLFPVLRTVDTDQARHIVRSFLER